METATLTAPSRKALAQAKDLAIRNVSVAKMWFSVTPYANRTWSGLEKRLGISIPDIQKSNNGGIIQSIDDLKAWGTWYVNSVEARLASALDSTSTAFKTGEKTVVAAAKDITNFTKVGEFTLLPEQQAVYDAVRKDWWETKKHRVALQDGRTGAGKTAFALALIKEALERDEVKNGFYVFPIIICCPPSLSEHWMRHLERGGMGSLIGNTIYILPYSALSASQGNVFVKTTMEYDGATGKEVEKLEWKLAMRPFLLVLDESHRVNNAGAFQTRAILALLSSENSPYTLFMSATPGVAVNNFRCFAIATKAKILDMTVTEKNFPTFAGLICNEPAKPNRAAAKRLRELLSPFIYSMPKVKWPHKAINSVILVPFSSDKDRETYNGAYTRYLEKCQKLGKNVDFGRFEQFVALGQFRRTVEPLRADALADRCHERYSSGEVSPVVGCAYRDTVIRLVFRLIQHGYKRKDISVIWGGKDEIKTSLILRDEDFNELFKRTAAGEELTPRDIKRIEATLRFKEEKLNYSEKTDAETEARLAKISEFGLMGAQTPNQRQVEIDRFQNGDSKICIFTLAAGGVGLSLDHWRKDLRPREGYFTPTYSGPEFQQALGRLPRRLTLSDTYQYIVGMLGTIEETHVMPLIDKKLQCIAEITNSDYSLINFHLAKVDDTMRVRDKSQAEKDAEDEKTQIHNMQTDSEADDDDSDDTTTT